MQSGTTNSRAAHFWPLRTNKGSADQPSAVRMSFVTEADRRMMRTYYDKFGNEEWERLEKDLRGRVSLEVHKRFLARFINEDDRVLEIGAGPGRFTLELIDLGARVAVTDFSKVQLKLNKARLAHSPSIESWKILDVCDTSMYADGEFDTVLAYGGSLSYAFENVDEALSGLFRIVRPGGVIVASVMSLLGTWRYFLGAIIVEAENIGEDANDAVLRTGDLRHMGGVHVCQMFRSRDISELVERCGGKILAISGSNWTSLEESEALVRLENDPDRWRRYIEHEIAACSEPGALDGGTHILFAATRKLI